MVTIEDTNKITIKQVRKYHGSSHDTPARQSEVHLKTSKHYASFQSFFAV